MASLVRYPGGCRNKGGYGTGPYYVRVWLPNLKKNKLICCNTEDKKKANKKLKFIQNIEWMVRTDQKLLLAGLSEHRNDGKLITSIEEALGFDTSLSLEKATEMFIDSCRKKVSPKTVKSYELAMDNMTVALGRNTRATELGKGDYEKLLNYLQSKFSNKTTVNIRLRSIRVFINYLVENGHLDRMPFKVKMLKIDDSLPKFITPEEMTAIYSKVEDPVMLAAFKVYEATGMRLAELFSSRLEGKFLKVVGKGSKQRIIPIPEFVISDYKTALSAFNKDVEEAKGELSDETAIEKRKTALVAKYTDRITHAFTDARRDAGIKGRKSLHALRHTFALRMLVELGDIYLVKELLGHSSVTTTEIYTKFPKEYLKEVFNSKSEPDKRQRAYA